MNEVCPRIGLIGCGRWGQNLLRNLEALGALSMVCDKSSQARERAAALAPGTQIVADPDRVFAADVDGVVIATPASSHVALTEAALGAGKDVLVEKPLALTYREGAELVRLAKARGRVLMVGHVLEYHPGVRRLVELAHSGELGQIRYIGSTRLNHGNVCRDKNVLWSFAPHDVAIILRLMGRMPTSVSARGAGCVQPDITDVANIQLAFDDGAGAQIHVSWLHPFKEQRLTVVGSEGAATFDDVAKELMIYRGSPTDRIWSKPRAVLFASEEPLRLECQAFLGAITSRRAPLSDGASGLQVLEVLQLADEALVAGSTAAVFPMHAITAVRRVGT